MRRFEIKEVYRRDSLEVLGKLSDKPVAEQQVEIFAVAGQADILSVEPVLLSGGLFGVLVSLVKVAVEGKDLLFFIGLESLFEAFAVLKNKPPVVLHDLRGSAVEAAAVVEAAL